ncbi:MAG: response regulator transcription factor [Alistipes sp.]
MKILIIEDEKELSASIDHYLHDEGYVCECAADYKTACEKIHLYSYDCVIVDLTLPDGNGLDVVRELKSTQTDTGIIIVSARNATEDKIEGLDMGADDYLAKPFHLSELNARLKSVLRRRNFGGQKEFCFNEIRIFPDSRRVAVGEHTVELTRKEYDLLMFLVMNENRVLTKEAIVEHLWGDYMGIEADTFDALYTHMRMLRKKLQDQGAKDYIDTIYAVGYKFASNKEE